MTIETSSFPWESVLAQTGKAVQALQEHHKKKEEEESVFLVLALNKIAEKAPIKPVRLSVPHPWRNPSSSSSLSICLITKDPHAEYKKKIGELNLPCIAKVTGVAKLSGKTKPFEAKRALCSEYDMFMADERVLPLLPKILGKTFFEKKKHPVPVDMTKRDVRVELVDAIQATYLHLSTGPCTVIRVGLVGQSGDQITANVEAVIRQLEKKLPGGGLANIRSLQMKTSSSIALPVMNN